MISSAIQEAFDEAIKDIGVSLSLSTDFLSPPMELQNRTDDFKRIKDGFELIYGKVPALHRNLLNTSIILTAYASYEAYVHELMEMFLLEYCTLCPTIEFVDPSLQKFHLRVVSERIKRGKIEERNTTGFVDSAISELSSHIAGRTPVEIDKSICREIHNNFRLDELSDCLGRIGAKGFKAHLKSSVRARTLFSKHPLTDDDIGIPLDEFVVTRNQIMHSFDLSQSKGKDWIEEKLKLISLVVTEVNDFLGLKLEGQMNRIATA